MARTMSKDITEDILLKAGFEKVAGYYGYVHHNKKYVLSKLHYKIQILIYDIFRGRYYHCVASNDEVPKCDEEEIRFYGKHKNYYNEATADIQTIEHFNKLMELIDIDFRLKED